MTVFSAVLSAYPFTGLTTDYVSMIQAAFQPKWWSSDVIVDSNSHFLHLGRPLNTDEYSQMEYNFSMFWGVAIQMYESTLVSDSSRFDQFMEGNRGALSLLSSAVLIVSRVKVDAPIATTAANLLTQLFRASFLAAWWSVCPADAGMMLASITSASGPDDDMGIAASDPSGLASLSAAQLASMGQFSGTLFCRCASRGARSRKDSEPAQH